MGVGIFVGGGSRVGRIGGLGWLGEYVLEIVVIESSLVGCEVGGCV